MVLRGEMVLLQSDSLLRLAVGVSVSTMDIL